MPKLTSLPVPLPRLAVTAALAAAVGFGIAAVATTVGGHYLQLPEGAEPVEYADPAAPDAADAPSVAEDEATSARPTVRNRAPSSKSWDVIVRRNIFDSTAVYNPAAVVPGGGDCRDSTVKLIATVVADLPEYSSALISVSGGKDSHAQGFVIGDDVAGEGRITSIDQKKVCTDGGACICMGNEGGVAKSSGSAATGGDDASGITKLAENKYAIDQSTIDGAMGNLEMLASQVRASPHKGADGQIDGYRLSAIRKGSMFEKLGIKNGDVVKAVNGKPLTSTDGAMALYGSLSSEKNFSFDITRRSQDSTLEYEIR